jgi:glycerol-3-phosphate dehydrogenase
LGQVSDIFIIGGGINGVGIAADAAGRGLSVTLVEQNDLASGTSSASTKLIHGGLRYLEYYEFLLVRKALSEREVLLNAAPHIIRPLRFLLPQIGLRPAWLIRLGLFIYDHLGGRKILPATNTTKLNKSPYKDILKDHYKKAFVYSDCWVDDARLVVLNACVARDKGAEILCRHKCVSAVRADGIWRIDVTDTQTDTHKTFQAKVLINAAGPWVGDVIKNVIKKPDEKLVRLVKGSHIIVRKIFEHNKAYLFQGNKGRVIFAIPYENDYTLIGTTDQDYDGNLEDVTISEMEIDYLCDVANEYFKRAISPDDVISHYAGVRPLYNDGASDAKEATRDFVLKLDETQALLNIIGGKITTYRILAEQSMAKIRDYFPNMKGKWTASSPLPGGNFNISEYEFYLYKLASEYPFLKDDVIDRYFASYGTKAWDVLKDCENKSDMGQHFGHGLYETEVKYLIENEWAMTAEDILWRRTKLGLHMNKDQKGALIHWFSVKPRV